MATVLGDVSAQSGFPHGADGRPGGRARQGCRQTVIFVQFEEAGTETFERIAGIEESIDATSNSWRMRCGVPSAFLGARFAEIEEVFSRVARI